MVKLKRTVTLFEAVMYCLSIILGAGIYVLIGVAAQHAGNVTWLAFIFAALIAATTGLSYAELTSKLPFDAAEYVFTKKAFNNKSFSFGIGWLKIITLTIAMAAVSLGFGHYLSEIIPVHFLIGALIILALAVLINVLSVKGTMEFGSFFVLLTVIGLVLIVVSGAGHIGSVDYLDFTFGWEGVFTAAALIFFAFLGFEDIGSLGEETKNPQKVLPQAIIISVLVSTVLYGLVSLVAISVVPWNQLDGGSSLSQVAGVTMGSAGSMVISFIALAATASTVIILLFSVSRMIFGMAERKSLPPLFMRLSKKRIPYVAVLFVGAMTIGFILLKDLKFIASITDFGALFTFTVVNFSVIVLRYKHPEIKGKFRMPVNLGKFPLLAGIGALFSFYLLMRIELLAALVSLAVFGVGIVLFHFYSRHRQIEHDE